MGILVYVDQANIFQYSVQYGGKADARQNAILSLDPFKPNRVQSCPSGECFITITLPDSVMKVGSFCVSHERIFVYERELFCRCASGLWHKAYSRLVIIEQAKSRVNVYYQLTNFHQNHRLIAKVLGCGGEASNIFTIWLIGLLYARQGC